MAQNPFDRVVMLPEDWNYLRICQHCKVMYSDRTTVGAWGCRYHPGAFNAAAKGNNFGVGRYDCCGQACDPHSRAYVVGLKAGCTRCDHTVLVRNWGPQDSVTLPIENMLDLTTYRESLHVDELRGTITIDRCDLVTTEHRIDYGRAVSPPSRRRRRRPGEAPELGYTLAQWERHLKQARQDTWFAYEGEHYPVTSA
jgi:hypothetical protein